MPEIEYLPAGIEYCPSIRSLQELDVRDCGNEKLKQRCRKLTGTIPKIILECLLSLDEYYKQGNELYNGKTRERHKGQKKRGKTDWFRQSSTDKDMKMNIDKNSHYILLVHCGVPSDLRRRHNMDKCKQVLINREQCYPSGLKSWEVSNAS
uniref:Uncharacterized protein n=1 Tax=Oryza barthii TaxID=65489 RepID=A0A0D3G0M8_9ORYZ